MASKDTSVSDGQAAVLENHRLNCSLDQIRLIRLNPRADTESESSVITASIGIFSLSTTVPYLALSYVWGTDEPSNTIVLDGQPMRVRDNLWNFLDTFCREGNTSYLWIDALCINQSYTPERNHQVTLMGQIYSQATKVIAWLGMDPDLMEATRELVRVEGAFSSKALFGTADYWRRAWIQQEFMLAKEVEIRCGSVTLSTEIVNKMTSYPGHPIAHFITIYSARVVYVLRSRRNRMDNKPFSDIVDITYTNCQTAYRLECSDPRDQVYAFLGLIDEETLRKYPINVDYEMSNTQLCDILEARYKKMKSDGSLDRRYTSIYVYSLRGVLGCPNRGYVEN